MLAIRTSLPTSRDESVSERLCVPLLAGSPKPSRRLATVTAAPLKVAEVSIPPVSWPIESQLPTSSVALVTASVAV